MEKSLYILIILCLVACTKQENTQREKTPLKVKTMIVAQQGATSTSRYVGTIEPVKEIPLSLQSAGRVVNISVKNGQRVRAGQTILAIDNTQALNAFHSAEASLRHAQDGYDRVSKVHEKGVVSDQKMVEVESQLSQAKSLYAAAKQQLNECTLVATCEGIINGLSTEKGQTIIPGTRLCSIIDVSGFSVRFTVPEKEINGLEGERMSGFVECTAVDTVLPIHIIEKSVAANSVTHTYEVVARIQGGTDVLLSGMVGKVTLNGERLAENDENIVIPASCILLKPEGPTVWIMEQGRAVRRAVVTDGYQANGVRVKDGLLPGDTLIIEGYQKLYNNAAVIN